MSAPKDQHFLIDRNAVRRIADLVDLRDRLVLEIGPGEGILTGELLSRGAKVNAVEIDPDLVDELTLFFADDGRGSSQLIPCGINSSLRKQQH